MQPVAKGKPRGVEVAKRNFGCRMQRVRDYFSALDLFDRELRL